MKEQPKSRLTKLTMEDILKPGAVLEVKKIDFNDPAVQEIVRNCKKEQARILKYKKQKPLNLWIGI